MDVIIGSSSSENLRQVLLKAGGDQVQSAYAKEYKNNPNSLIISTPSGHLHCKKIFFLKWDPDDDQEILRQSIADLIWNVIQNVLSYNFTSIAFPALGCGEHACSVDIVVKTMVREMKQQIQKRKLPWTVKFIIHPHQENVYDEFCKQLLSSDQTPGDYQIPSTWQNSKDDQLRFVVPKKSDEYKSIITKFDEAMKGNNTEIIKLERIQNERWYMQYMAHSKDFKKRLHEDTEKRLYHGCPEEAANSIIQDCFNRSFAGVNGIYFFSEHSIRYIFIFRHSIWLWCLFFNRRNL
jgi:O-acetyl-ADP-ribose deacetylase (regulator of RNase III)